MDKIKIIGKKPGDLTKIEYILKKFLAEEDYHLFEIGLNDLEEFGSKLGEPIPVIHIINVLFSLGQDTSKYKLNYQTKIVINTLGKIGHSVIERKLTDALNLVLKSTGDLGVKAVENKWEDATKLSVDILGDLYVAACKNKLLGREREVDHAFVTSIQHIASTSMGRDLRFAIDFVVPSLKDLCLKLIEHCLKEIKMSSKCNMYSTIRHTIDLDIAVVGIGNILSKALGDKVIDEMNREFENIIKDIAEIGAEIAVVDNLEYIDERKKSIDLNGEDWCTLRLKDIFRWAIDSKNTNMIEKFVMIIGNFSSEISAKYTGGFYSGAFEIENLSLRYQRELVVKYRWTIRLLKSMGDMTINKSTSEEIIKEIKRIGGFVKIDDLSKFADEFSKQLEAALKDKKNENSRAQSDKR